MKNDRNCLITGAAGFIGTALAQKFKLGGYEIYGIDLCPPRDKSIWDGFIEAQLEDIDFNALVKFPQPSIICHLAGPSSVSRSMDDANGDFRLSVPGTARLLAWNGKERRRARLLYFSSAAVYGEPNVLPIAEDSPLQPISPYGVHKAASEILVSGYGRLYGFQTINIRPFSVYGPGLNRQVVWDIAAKAKRAVHEGNSSITLFGTGNETRDFISIDDLAAITCILSSTELPNDHLDLNLATGQETAIASLAELIVSKIYPSHEVLFSERQRPGDPARWCADISLLKSIVTYEATSISDGIDDFIEWFNRESYES